MKVVLWGTSTANVIGNPVDDKSEGVVMFFVGVFYFLGWCLGSASMNVAVG